MKKIFDEGYDEGRLKKEKDDGEEGEEEEAESVLDTRRRMKSIYLLFWRANPPKSRRSRHVFTDSKVQRFYNITAIVMMEEVWHLCSLWFYSPRPLLSSQSIHAVCRPRRWILVCQDGF